VEDSDLQHVLNSCLAFPVDAAHGTVGAGVSSRGRHLAWRNDRARRKIAAPQGLGAARPARATRIATGRVQRM
jgi:hypothetical protein